MIGMSSAGEAVSTPESDVWMTREGEAGTCRSQARKGAHDRGRITEEPCEVETVRHVAHRVNCPPRGSEFRADDSEAND